MVVQRSFIKGHSFPYRLYLKFTKIFNILHFKIENSVSSFTMTIMMKMEVEWLQKRSNFQAHRAQIHFDFKSLVFQSRKPALIFFKRKEKKKIKNQFLSGLSFKITIFYLSKYIGIGTIQRRLAWPTFFVRTAPKFRVLSIFYHSQILSRNSKGR